MIPSVTPNATATAASRQARSAATSRSERASSRPPKAATISAPDQSRSPVITAGVTWPNIRPARPAPTCTETMLLTTSAEGGTTVMRRLGPAAGLSARLQGAFEAPPSRVARSSPPPPLLTPGGAAPRRLAMDGRRNNGDRVTVTAVLPALFPAERAHSEGDPRGRPDGEDQQVAPGRPAAGLQYRPQAVGERAGGQQL